MIYCGIIFEVSIVIWKKMIDLWFVYHFKYYIWPYTKSLFEKSTMSYQGAYPSLLALVSFSALDVQKT